MLALEHHGAQGNRILKEQGAKGQGGSLVAEQRISSGQLRTELNRGLQALLDSSSVYRDI